MNEMILLLINLCSCVQLGGGRRDCAVMDKYSMHMGIPKSWQVGNDTYHAVGAVFT